MRNALEDKGIIIIIMKCCYVPSFAYSNVKMKCKSFVNISTASLADENIMSLFQMTGENRVSLLNKCDFALHAEKLRSLRRRFGVNFVLQQSN